MQFRRVELYGGAISCELPTTLQDMSQWRQVPDNQEMYSDVDTGATIIAEILERQDTVPDKEAATFFYYDLANANGCWKEQCTLESTQSLEPSAVPGLAAGSSLPHYQPCAYICTADGTQLISKYTNEKGKESEVSVRIAVLRYEAPIAAELMLSLSNPVKIHPESSDAKVIKRTLTAEESFLLFKRVVESLAIHNYGLFITA
ncbi:Ran-binding protein [Angomonas deanei]|uniref:Ran-interacting Mog1 protein, putative n=1 Tax=Angomonas deanei TaxID=59799 RepID=S9WHM5_9TRYP|nr:Ran-binding protein [Angomonas deanei]EPY37801.1 Ran-binding protein [Angomonas deanei]EPY38781.1 Ran-binding protein [Angomonas deanei]CAD2220790.1 Ran-interacting Mog1 protein, putative [Angomonas deanei]|eukprot:EPY36533.1 Ran-binding protein [Angomonas deanei]